VAQLYARRWDIELAFRLLKDYLGMSHWWSSKQELILVQIWVVLLLSHIVYALRERIATAATCEPCEVSVPRHGRTAPEPVQHLRAPARAACSRGSTPWPGACESTSRTPHTPGRAFVLSVSSTRSSQTTTRASRSLSACASTEANYARIGLSSTATEASNLQRDQGDPSGPS
jgi:hypothetical protein